MHFAVRRVGSLAVIIAMGLIGLRGTLLAYQSQSGSPSPAADYTPTVDPAGFTNVINNEYWPLKPGTKYIFEGSEDRQKQKDVVTVTFETKEIMGVECVVVLDEVSSGDVLLEKTYDWYAQDNEGNVWYFGEDSTEFDNGKASKGGSWEAGVNGALPGIVMESHLKVGDTYRQEYRPGVAEDMAEVISVTGSKTVKYGSFDNVITTREWTPLEPDVEERKFYAPGIGDINEMATKGGEEHQELVDVQTFEATPAATPNS
jgi:hypothetical protein